MSIIECHPQSLDYDDQQYYGVTNQLLQKKHHTIIDAYPFWYINNETRHRLVSKH